MAVNQRGKKWEARLRWRLPDGSETGVSQTFTRKKDAQDWELEQKINHKQGMVKQITTFIYVFDKYYDTVDYRMKLATQLVVNKKRHSA